MPPLFLKDQASNETQKMRIGGLDARRDRLTAHRARWLGSKGPQQPWELVCEGTCPTFGATGMMHLARPIRATLMAPT